ncbi:MAG: hypothetical protein ACM3X1_01460 [Ignavibacteriales bacterium]
MNKPFHLGKIDSDVDSLHHKNKYRRTHGWDCPYQDYGSNRHYNTQRHIDLTHGCGSGEPIDHMTGETREEKSLLWESQSVQEYECVSQFSYYISNRKISGH